MKYGLIFDVDGVIADTEAVNARASIEVFAELFGVPDVRREDFAEGLGRGAEEYVQAAARVHHLEFTAEQVARATKLRQEYFLHYLGREPLKAFPGVRELMQAALQHKDFRLAVATSSTRTKSEAVLRSADVPYKKMVYITGSEVKNKKPDPELFAAAVRQLHLEPSRCVVIEDAPNGVAAAKAAGCACIAVTNSTAPDKLCQADMVTPTLAAVSLEILITLIDGNPS